MKIIAQHSEELNKACQKHLISQLYAFGSILTANFDTQKSDIDFFVVMPNDLDPLDKGEHLLDFWLELEQIFDRKIDLLTDTSVNNPYLLQEINQTKRMVYDNKNEEMFV